MRKSIIKITGLTLKKGQRLSLTVEKNMTKIICSIINGFHFNIPDVVDELEKILEKNKSKGGLDEILNNIFDKEEEEKEKIDDGLASDSDNKEEIEQEIEDQIENILEKPKKEDKINGVSNKQAIFKTLNHSFIPSLFKHLKEQSKRAETNDDYLIRIHVAVAIVKLLKKTTNQDFNTGFARLIRNIVGCLRSKVTKIRDRAREALVQVNLNVSGYLFHYTVDELQKGLRKGYQRHVKSYTLSHLIDSLVEENHFKVGQLDHCIDSAAGYNHKAAELTKKKKQSMISILMDELFGKVGAEKDLQDTNYVKIKETKSKRALKTYEILSQYINFENTFIKFVTPLLNKADKSLKTSSIKKLEEILAIISTNILKNSSVTAESLLIVLYAIIKKGTTEESKLEEEEQEVEEEKFSKKRENALKYQTFKVLPIWQRDLSYFRMIDNELSKNMLLAFALSTIKKAMDVLPINDYKDKLDAFTKLYVVLMKSTDNRVLVNTLHILGKCIKLSLPNIKYHCRNIINNLFLLFTTSSDSEFMNSLFKCSTEMVTHMRDDLTDYQVGRLVEIIKANLEHYQMQANVYGCLKALVQKKVLNPHIYDLVDIIGDKMITHSNKSTRTICSSIFITFLIDYPLEEKRVEQHIHHLIKNLTYVGKDGRTTVLEVIEKLIPQFPTNILDKYSFLLFLSMILRTINEHDPECKQKANSTIKLLLENVSDSKRDDIIKTVLNWDYNAQSEFEGAMPEEMDASGRSAMMKRVTLLLIGLIITIEGEKFASKYFSKTFEI